MSYKIELKKLKEGRGSEETTNFSADVYIDGKLIATAYNSGQGGETEVTPYGKTNEQYKANGAKLNEVNSYFRSLPKAKPAGYSFEIQPSLEDTIDEMVENELKQKDVVKFQRSMVRYCEKAICFGNEKEYRSLGWKNMTLTQLMNANKPNADATIIAAIQNAKKQLKPGDRILNTNLGRFAKYI